jgi:hypothetical protein
VYLLPTIVGGGRGDIEEIRAAAFAIRGPGVRLHLYRPAGMVWPVGAREVRSWSVDRVERTLRIEGDRALTISAAFGVTAAAGHPGRFGRAGPWAGTVRALESLYGAGRVLHLSLEEFGRNLSAAQQESERWREGGRTGKELRVLRARADWTGRVARMRRLYRKYRALDRANLLVVIPTFLPSRSYRREFPEVIQCGPIPPPPPARRPMLPNPAAGSSRAPANWFWYASPSTSPALIPGLRRGSEAARRRLRLTVRSPRPFPSGSFGEQLSIRRVDPLAARGWDRIFRGSDLRIVTGSRSLLEALELGGPFLYYNGAGGRGAARRAHRPEKIRGLLELWRRAGVAASLRADLRDFARGRRVGPIVLRALTEPGWRKTFPERPLPTGFPEPYGGGDRLLRAIVADWSEGEPDSPRFARRWRSFRPPFLDS